MIGTSKSQQNNLEILILGVGPYFSASTLMNWTDFSDTAAVYSLFRVAKECVDNENDEDGMKLSTFEKYFWECRQKGSYNYFYIFFI